MEYSFKYISTDCYELHYVDKNNQETVKPFKRTVEMAQKLQGIYASARLKMYKDLTKQGITKKDLIIEIKNNDGSISYDESNFREYEEEYTKQEGALILTEIINDCFGMQIADLIEDMGIDPYSNDINDVQQVALFSQKLTMILRGEDNTKTPSIENKEQIPGSIGETPQNNN